MPKKPARKTPAKAPKTAAKKKAPAGKRPDTIEALKEQFATLLQGQDVATMSDLKALMTSLQSSSVADKLSDEEADARYQAQELAFDAMGAASEAEARKLAKRALRLDPDCVDALAVLIDLEARTPRELIEGLQKAVAAGERSLGEQFIRENKGHFWLMLDTRPYMRALQTLGEALRSQGIRLDAIKVYEKMLELNPNDNQGVRDPLLGLYLETGDVEGAGRLLKKYKNDASATFAWGRVLERFLAGDVTRAKAALTVARRVNRHMELYLTGQTPLPDELPDLYSPGSKEEAVLCVSFLGGAWVEQQQVCAWLFDQLGAMEHKPAVSKESLMKVPVPGKKVQ